MKKEIQNAIQFLWQNYTPAGKEFAKRNAMERRFATVKRKPAVQNIIKEITDSENVDFFYRLQGTDYYGNIEVLRYCTVDQEIEIHIHRDKGDLYGIFRKINETQPEVLISLLTQPDTRLAMCESVLNDVVTQLGAMIPTEPERESRDTKDLTTEEKFHLILRNKIADVVVAIRKIQE